MLLGLKYITWDLGASHLQAALPMVRTWGWGAWDQQFLSSPSTSPICPISFFSSTGQNVPSWFPDARSMCPSRTTEQRMRAWESESNWSQTASRWWQKQNAYVCMVMSEVINKRKKKKKQEKAEVQLLFLMPLRAILSLRESTTGSINTGISLRKQNAFQRVTVSNCVNTDIGTTNPKIINTIRQAFLLCQCKRVCTGDSQGLCGMCPYVRGTNGTQENERT